jgi:hypothetical protein
VSRHLDGYRVEFYLDVMMFFASDFIIIIIIIIIMLFFFFFCAVSFNLRASATGVCFQTQ